MSGLRWDARRLHSAWILVVVLMTVSCHGAEGREMKGCFVARFERFEFHDATDGTTYFVVAANDRVTRSIRGLMGNATFVAAPVAVAGNTKETPAGSGPNARYQAMIKANAISSLDDQQLCVLPNQ